MNIISKAISKICGRVDEPQFPTKEHWIWDFLGKKERMYQAEQVSDQQQQPWPCKNQLCSSVVQNLQEQKQQDPQQAPQQTPPDERKASEWKTEQGSTQQERTEEGLTAELSHTIDSAQVDASQYPSHHGPEMDISQKTETEHVDGLKSSEHGLTTESVSTVDLSQGSTEITLPPPPPSLQCPAPEYARCPTTSDLTDLTVSPRFSQATLDNTESPDLVPCTPTSVPMLKGMPVPHMVTEQVSARKQLLMSPRPVSNGFKLSNASAANNIGKPSPGSPEVREAVKPVPVVPPFPFSPQLKMVPSTSAGVLSPRLISSTPQQVPSQITRQTSATMLSPRSPTSREASPPVVIRLVSRPSAQNLISAASRPVSPPMTPRENFASMRQASSGALSPSVSPRATLGFATQTVVRSTSFGTVGTPLSPRVTVDTRKHMNPTSSSPPPPFIRQTSAGALPMPISTAPHAVSQGTLDMNWGSDAKSTERLSTASKVFASFPGRNLGLKALSQEASSQAPDQLPRRTQIPSQSVAKSRAWR
eukprot:gnl/MRDRNA2_/MRDRNA2_27995_c0_seq1.p1 gnl/MRDRNA2_/MRDRNA2_27995_c0~~gnl/MRDRNA2_/MRDRNA2_27995_c0_seq1.p1  ORF type:complete len:533 (-),score=74.78 gnl/MRDRNA2_/MRDRNA2_27995_c0_seq1:95-1693(-)